ncbi:MAG TPA: amino acid adenylation domain-containing protein, partial [Tahibacter sp.]|uniref:non-ribosomal peptide synthetase n=1 Tax=Tahibacter sp. TaxID=2056211 RepID=UPI002C38C114
MANELNGAAWPAVVAASDAVDDPVVTCGAADGAVPLALAQRRLWFLSTLGRAAARAYVMPAGMRLRGALDVPALRRALDLLAQRHDALRTRFGLADGEPVQSIAAAAGARFALVEHDLRRDADAEAALDALVEHESAAPFDLEHGPLIRGRVVALPGDEHVWLLSAHHAIFDGRSMERFAHELADLYRGLRDGAAVVLPPAGRYADCVAIQRTDAFAATLREQSAYWREALRDAPPTSTLPADRARGARHDFAGGLVDGRLDATRTARLRALARRHESSLFGVLLAAWVVLLQRLNRQDEAVVGVTTDGRTQREYDGVVGCFVGTVPVRVTRASTPAAAIRATAQRLRAARAHQDLPFDQIVEAAHAERSLAQNPLFQTALTWYGSRIESFRFDGTEPSALPAVARRYGVAPDGASRDALILYGGIGDRVHAKHDVTLLLWEAGGSIHIGAEYATALYDRDTIARCLGYWTRLLDAFADDDAQPLARIALVDPVERRQLVDGWNATAVARPATTLPALFAQTAQAMPGAPALNCGGAILSYAELQRRVRRVAQRLAAHGIGRGSRVGVAMARRSELVVALLAVLDAGAAYVPLDPLHPPERRAHILRDAGVAALLVCGDESGTDGRDAVPRIDVAAADGTDAPDIAQSPAAPGDLAYVIYTSGTTGKPKGVAIGHAALLNLLLAMRDELAIAAGDRVLALTTIAFDIAALELFLPLIAGGCVVLADRAAAQDPRALAALLERERVDVMQATPTGWRVLLDGGWTGRAGLKALCGGEALPSELARRLAARVGTLWNVYGPTETTIWSTIQRIDAGCAAATTACIGRPLANTQAYVLDGGGELAPTGIVGELYLGGAGLARGYVGLDALTRERFVANPFAAGERLYRTGDLAWRDRDGRLHHAGRTDAQIKLNGYRIELEEIEAQLAMHAAVREAAVALRRDAAGYARLVGYCVLADERGDAAADRTDELRAHLLTSLPSYMVPEAFVVLEHLPVSPNGKTDRAALPEPLAIARGGHEAPRPGVESEVAAVWSELLDGRVIDRRDHFFRLGGHSLLAVRVLVRLRRALGVEVNVAELFAHPTLDAFAAAVARAGRSALPPIVPAARSGDLPLSSAQQRLWFLAQTGADASRAYHMPVVLHLDGALDRDALRRAIAAILARHEALRTVFPARAGRPVQQIRDTADIALPWRDASIDDDASAVDTAIAAEVARAFDLTCALPLRVALLRCGPRAHIAVITIHHIACDGWSLALFLRELQAHYAAACCGDTAALPALAVQYADYAQWLQNVQGATGFALATAYWTQRLADAPALFELPSDRPRPAQQDYSGDLVACTIGADLTRGLHRLAEQCGATLFMTALAAWVALLARLSDARDFVLGMPSANRDSAETEALIGFFANTLALRFELGADPTVAELVALTRDEVLAAQQHRELPFEQLVEALNPPRSAACTPLFQIAFAWQSVPPVDLALPGVSTTQRPLYRAGTAKFDLTLYLWQSGDTLRGGVEYATSLFDRATIERYLAHWNVLLRAFVADPQRRLMALPLLTPAQREALIGVACGPRVAFGEGRVHRLVEVTARRERDAPAVVQGARSLSYAELDRRATALAQRLRAHDLGAGARIGVLMRRSPELIVALLGVLKCGAAYVLLDTAAPAQRTACLLVDAQARAVVGDGPEPLELGDGALALPRFVVAPDDDAIPGRDPAPAPAVERDDDIAYVVFTSGSTGTPKGVLVGHRGFANFVQAMRDALGLQRGDRVSGACGLGFDASLIDIWPTLCAGATLVLTPVEPAQDADAFLRWWRAERLHCSMLPTPLAEIVLAHGIVPPTLRTLATGGAALTRRPPAGATYRLLNAYGPAEASVVTTIGDVAHDDRITIGQPLPNVCAYVLDDAGEPQPIGIPGELYVGGAGVAAGYIGLTELDESRFPPDPFSSAPGARLYRSGDRVRRLADGRIEYLGRRDEQIKLRGMRIEPGEIETCLAALPAVREAAVVHVANAAGEGRLVAYVSVRAEATADLEDERIADWQRLYDDNYRGPNRDALFNFDGWNSSLTGEPIPLDEMEQWQDETVARIRALRPRRVLEIGCGSGLLLLRLAPDCARYVGVDLSQEALVSLQRKIEQAGIRGVELVHARADALDTLAPESFDTVILNSVAQYFPDRDYLERVVAAALARLQPGGALFVGDVRNLLLLDAFHQAIQQARATPAADLAEAARRAAAQEKELLIAPAWFARAGAGTHAVQVLPKTAPNANEMTAFRYDVVLRDAMPAIARQRVFEAHDTGAFAAAMAWARANPDAVAILTPLRNALVDSDSDGDNGDTEDSCIAPADAVRRAIHGDLIAQPSWIASDTRGRFHLLITASDPALLHDHVALLRGVAAEADGAMTNAPTQQANEARLRRELVAALARKLPEYMIPAQFVFLARLPLSRNGKVDRARLPQVDLPRSERFRPLRSDTERRVAAIWNDVLGARVLGASDHFFELGGHSLAAVQVLARVRDALNVEVSLADLFAHPILADFAERLP